MEVFHPLRGSTNMACVAELENDEIHAFDWDGEVVPEGWRAWIVVGVDDAGMPSYALTAFDPSDLEDQSEDAIVGEGHRRALRNLERGLDKYRHKLLRAGGYRPGSA